MVACPNVSGPTSQAFLEEAREACGEETGIEVIEGLPEWDLLNFTGDSHSLLILGKRHNGMSLKD